jgi:hypothetical protein
MGKHSPRMLLIRQAYEEAAALLENKMSGVDLDERQSVEDEDFVREYIRTEIVGFLRQRSKECGLKGDG